MKQYRSYLTDDEEGLTVDDSEDEEDKDEDKEYSPDDPLFNFTCLVSASGIHLSAHCIYGDRQILAFVMGTGAIAFYYIPADETKRPVVKHVPWFFDGHKRITAMCFNPSGSWLITAVVDGSIFIVPALALVDPKAVSTDQRWATNDVTVFPNVYPVKSPSSSTIGSSGMYNIEKATEATSIVWWNGIQELHHIVIIGTNYGDIYFFSLTSGMLVGSTYIKSGGIELLQVCEDNIQEVVFLLVTGEHHQQWKLLLEQVSTSYCWPFENGKHASNGDLSSSSQGSYDVEIASRCSGQLPTARSRLQGLKQMSVEKLASLKQKLAETRSRGASAFGHLRKDSSSSLNNEDTSRTRKSSITSECSNESLHLSRTSSGPHPESMTDSTSEEISLWPQQIKGRHLLSAYHIRSGTLTVRSVSLEVAPLFIYHVPPDSINVLLTEKLLFVTDTEKKVLSVVSCFLSGGRFDDSDYDAQSVIEKVRMPEGEKILALYKLKYSSFIYKDEPYEEEKDIKTDDSDRDEFDFIDEEPDDSDERSDLEKVLINMSKNAARRERRRHVAELREGSASRDNFGNTGRNKREDKVKKISRQGSDNRRGTPESERRSGSQDSGRDSSVKNESNKEKNSERKNISKSEGETENAIEISSPPVDTCLVITDAGLYEIRLRQPITQIFMDLVLKHRELEKAELLARAFGLNLQELLEYAGDKKLADNEFVEALSLYKLSKCRSLKSVLKFVAAGHSYEITEYILLLLMDQCSDLSSSERMHMSNMVVMSYMEQMLRHSEKKDRMYKLLLNFLNNNGTYDEVLTVTIAGQTRQWDVIQFMASQRGLIIDVLDVVSEVLHAYTEDFPKQTSDRKISSLKLSEMLDCDLWFCISDKSLLQGLLSRPNCLRIHLKYTEALLPYLKQPALDKLASFYDPSTPVLHSEIVRMLKSRRRRVQSGGSLYSSLTDTIDSTDTCDTNDEIRVPMEDFIQMFLLILLYMAKERNNLHMYLPQLMHKIQMSEEKNDEEEKDLEDLLPSLPLQSNILSAGCSHVALIRNGVVYTWGSGAHGCLGTGPMMARYSEARPVNMFVTLRLEVISVSCGRQHTLALTNNGVYSWGFSQYGQLGVGKISQSPYPKLVEKLTKENIIGVSAGQYHSLALSEDGRVFSWGWGVHGQLGHGSVEDAHYPVLVEDLVGKVVVQICGGHAHSMALTAEGDVFTFGSSVFGQLGNCTSTKSSRPIKVTALNERICMISTSYFHNLAVSISNKLYIWGASPQVLRLQAQAQKRAKMLQQNIDRQESPVETSSIGTTSSKSQTATGVLCVSVPTTEALPLSRESLPSVKKSSSETGLHSSSVTDAKSAPNVPLSRTLTREKLRSFILSNTRSEKRKAALQQSKSISTISSVVGAPQNSELGFSCDPKDNTPHNKPDRINSESISDIKKSSNIPDKITINGSLKTISTSLELPCINQDGHNPEPSTDSSVTTATPERISGGSGPDSSSEEFHKDRGSEKSLELNKIFPGMETPSDISDAYAMSSVVVSPTMEFKGLLPGAVSPEDKKQNVTSNIEVDKKDSSSSTDENQAHLTPQLVNTSLVNGAITQISCGCHHSALLTKDGDLYVWGRNIDGQLGNGSRKEILIPTLLSVVTNRNTSSDRLSANRKKISGIIPNVGEKIQFQKVCCGCEYTVAVTGDSSGAKVWAWGSNTNGQLGKVPAEEARNLDGRLVMLRTTKRVIKLPHGSNNVSDSPREVPGIPASSISFKGGTSSGQSSRNRWSSNHQICPPLESLENPSYGRFTLHFTMQKFHGYYDSKYLLTKCLELEDYQCAARLATLDRNYHMALSYQLKALALASSDASDSLQPEVSLTEKTDSTEKLNKIQDNAKCESAKNMNSKDSTIPSKISSQSPFGSVEISVTSCAENLSVVESGDLVTDCAESDNILCGKEILEINSHHQVKANSSLECNRSGGKSVTSNVRKLESEGKSETSCSNSRNLVSNSNGNKNCDMHVFAIEGGKEQMSDKDQNVPSPESTSSVISEDKTSAVQKAVSSNMSDSVGNLLEATLAFQKKELLSLANCDKSVIGTVENRRETVKVNPSSKTSHVNQTSNSESNSVTSYVMCNLEQCENKNSTDGVQLESESMPSTSEMSPTGEPFITCDEPSSNSDLISQASCIVEYYMSIMEDDSHYMMSRLLEQGFEFWLDHSLPVSCLESLLIKHMGKFSYPLGLLFFGTLSDKMKNANVSSEGVSATVTSMLKRLSSHFSLQLCSMLLSHITEKGSCPEYMHQLAMLTSCNSKTSCDPQFRVGTNIFQHRPSQTQDQLLQIILQNLGVFPEGSSSETVVKQLCINLHEEEISACASGDSVVPDRMYIFSCGHHYSAEEFERETLPELNQHLLELNQPLPDTAALLRSLYNADSSVIDLACPKCVSNHLHAHMPHT